MKARDEISDEMLYALIDGELEQNEAERIYARISADETLGNRLCVLRSMKDMVRLAYNASFQAPGIAEESYKKQGYWGSSIAAALLLTLGLGAGWVLHGSQNNPSTIEALDENKTTHLAGVVADPRKILLHIDSASPQKFSAALDRAENILNAARQHNGKLQVEILANSNGLNLLRVGHSPYADRIAQLTRAHDNLRFIVCAQTLARFTREEGKVVLLPEAEVAHSAIGEVVDRLQKGWTYTKI